MDNKEHAALRPPTAGDVGEIVAWLRAKTAPRTKPTIAELEAILKEPDQPITIRPDGSIGPAEDNTYDKAADLITRLAAERDAAVRERDEARAEADEAEGKAEELAQIPWPKWAQQILKGLEKVGYQYDAGEEIDLPGDFIDHVNEWVRGIEHDAKAKATTAEAALALAREALGAIKRQAQQAEVYASDRSRCARLNPSDCFAKIAETALAALGTVRTNQKGTEG